MSFFVWVGFISSMHFSVNKPSYAITRQKEGEERGGGRAGWAGGTEFAARRGRQGAVCSWGTWQENKQAHNHTNKQAHTHRNAREWPEMRPALREGS